MAAQDRDFLDLILLGFELCGCYSPASADEQNLAMRHPLTCVSDIRDKADELKGVKGVSAARKAR